VDISRDERCHHTGGISHRVFIYRFFPGVTEEITIHQPYRFPKFRVFAFSFVCGLAAAGNKEHDIYLSFSFPFRV